MNNDKVITNKIDIAEHFNSYFVNIGPNLASTLKPEGKKQFIEYHLIISSERYVDDNNIHFSLSPSTRTLVNIFDLHSSKIFVKLSSEWWISV